MSTSSPAFAFEVSPEPLFLTAACSLAARICAGDAVTRQVLNRTMHDHFGGSDAQGRWSVRDAYAALELAQVFWLQQVLPWTSQRRPPRPGGFSRGSKR